MNTNEIKFGRTIQHDARSLEYKVPLESEIKSILWRQKAPVLNQGSSNACVGMAFTQMLNAAIFNDLRVKIAGSKAYLDEQFAYKAYQSATEIDEFVGQFPTEDTGTSALAMCKVALRNGWISEYQTAIGWEEVKKAIQTKPVLIGTFWTAQMNRPDDNGFIEPVGQELGGHEVLMIGLNVEKEYVTLLSSYGDTYGKQGRVKMKFNYFAELLHNSGDAMIIKP